MSQLKIAVLGAGHWGPNLIRNFHTHDHSEVVRVVDRDAERRALVASRYPGVTVSGEPEDAFSDQRVDAVVIATPTATHYALTRAAIEAGKHVLVEKPIARSVAEADELCGLAEERARVLMVGHVFLFNGAVRYVRTVLQRQGLGRLHYLTMVRTNLGPIRTDVDAAWDLATHDISIANDWLGGPPLAAAAHGGSWINADVADAVFATLWYPNDVMAHLHVSWLSPRKVRDITVVGDTGMLTFDDMNLSEPVRLYDKHVTDARRPGFVDSFATFRTAIREGDIVIPKVTTGEPLRAECDHFLETIRKGGRPTSDGRTGLDVVRALAALERSMRHEGRREPV